MSRGRRAIVLGLGVSLVSLAGARALQEAPPPTSTTGTRVQWKGWTFHWAVRPREGLVLNGVTYRGRSVLKSASLVEIFVPYHPGQPRPEDSLDGMGKNLIELQPGKDCLPGTPCQMFDASGQETGKRVVAMHEEPLGPVYMGQAGRANGSMLVLWCASRLGDYTYFIHWQFRDDGILMPRVGLTGRLSHTRAGSATPQASLVETEGGNWSAPAHVHNFYYRLDFDVDGPENDIVEEFSHRQDEPGVSLASKDEWTPIMRETGRSLDGNAFRTWRVADRLSTNRLGLPRSYELMPGGNGIFRGGSDEAITQADLWVTRYKPNELPLSSRDPRPFKRAMPTYLNGEATGGTDVVLWYSMHVHHRPRTEDWPAMPVEWAGFHLVPRDFLDTSPVEPR